MAQNENGKIVCMRTPLDDITRALFACLRGGGKREIMNEENELIALMQTCPLCFTALETLMLGKYRDREDDVVYERILWVCPNQRTQACYFPMNVLPIEVFWTRRTLEQKQMDIKPLPNLHLLPERLQHLYPKLFPESSNVKIDIERLIQYASYSTSVPKSNPPKMASRAVSLSAQKRKISIQTPPPEPDDDRPSTSASQKSFHSDMTVRNFLKQQIKMGHRFGASLPINSQSDEGRKLVDLCPNTSSALNSHILLKGADSEDIQNTLHTSTMRETMGGPVENMAKQLQTMRMRTQGLSQKQVVRMQGPLRKFKLADEAAATKEDKQEQQEQVVRQRARSSSCRYIAIPKMQQGQQLKQLRERVQQKQKNVPWRNDKEYRAIKQLDRKREIDSLTARLGLRATSVNPEFMMKGEERILEIHEGCLPDERDEGIVGTSDQTQNTERTSRASDVSGTRSASKRSLGEGSSTDEGKNKKLRTDATTPMKKSNLDEKLEEDVLRKQQAIIANAMRRRAVIQPPTATSSTRSEHPQQQFQASTGTELSGIPHDFRQHQHQQEVTMPSTSELAPINYAGEDELMSKFDAYERSNSAVEISQQQLGLDEDDEFDFGLGLENEFAIESGNGGGNFMGDGDFLRKLSRG